MQAPMHLEKLVLEGWAVAERELVLVKVRAPPGPARAEVLQLADIFRARIVDVSDVSLTVCATGDAGKVGHPAVKPAPVREHMQPCVVPLPRACQPSIRNLKAAVDRQVTEQSLSVSARA